MKGIEKLIYELAEGAFDICPSDYGLMDVGSTGTVEGCSMSCRACWNSSIQLDYGNCEDVENNLQIEEIKQNDNCSQLNYNIKLELDEDTLNEITNHVMKKIADGIRKSRASIPKM